ncbi:MAG: Rne/Rng family ribonuclease [Clostridia bacterium]|mgnify:FL=1|jgi:ribonuclease G|nr:Rne/Rng family ribonuclease [Clostridia bacterium]MEE0790875.1 Rne/Rng family ribonuclease [Clostridia bacterium]HCF64689.1 ribonuclease E/G [Clostridiales bacterium]HJJ09424.1 Rne/Rng family ribonuclease [Clostridiaceae bacterium]
MQEILVNVDKQRNKTIVVVENGRLVEKYQENDGAERLEGNIYIGKVQNVLLGMQAAFVDIGKEKNTFIHIRDVMPKASNETGNKNEPLNKYNIKDYIRTEMPILVQVKKDSTSKKGARVSTHMNISGRYIVLMPNSEFITVSKKIEDIKEKNRLLNIVKPIVPKGYGIIIRTSAEGKNETEIKEDLDKLIKKWQNILEKYNNLKKQKTFIPKIIYKNQGIIEKLILDLVDKELTRIIANDETTYAEIEKDIKNMQLDSDIKLELKKGETVLDIYDLETQLEKADNRKVWLKCGGFITIDKTEALTAIDVNSGKYVGTKDLAKTIFTVNKEATVEIAKQVRLRDIGGIIIIDYIDMENKDDKEKILKELEENLKKDRSKTQVIGFTPLDLLEMTRKHMWSND